MDLTGISQGIDPLWSDAAQGKERLVPELVHCCVKGQVHGIPNSPLYMVIIRMKLVHRQQLLIALGLGLQGSDDQRLLRILQFSAEVRHLMVCSSVTGLQLPSLLRGTGQEFCAK